MSVTAAAAHSGSYGCEIDGLTGSGGAYGICLESLAAQQSSLYTREYVEFTQELSVTAGVAMVYVIQQEGNDFIAWACLVRNTAGSYQWQIETYNPSTGVTNDYPSSSTFSGPIAGNWYCVELYTLKSSSAGIVTMWVNGVQVVTVTGLNTGADQINEFRAEAWTAWNAPNPGTVYLDDVVSASSYINP
jgi:hypothetical protein